MYIHRDMYVYVQIRQGDFLRACRVELIQGQSPPPASLTLGRGLPLPHTPSCPWLGYLELRQALYSSVQMLILRWFCHQNFNIVFS